MKSVIRDISLATEGKKKIEWVARYMPVLNLIKKEFEAEKPFAGKKITMSIHLEAKTAYLAKVLKAGGAEVVVTGSNPLSTQDDVAASLVADGIDVFAWYNSTPDEYNDHLKGALAFGPDIIIDDGGDLINLLHGELSHLKANVIGGCEETTTGVMRLRAREAEGKLDFPMVSVNDAYCKYLFDNRYGTGQSVWDGIMRTTNLIIAGKTVVVAGYGWCGKGVAMKAKGLGANVVVTEINAIKALEAYMDGFRVMSMDDAAGIGDIFVTVTGCSQIITKRHFQKMKDGVILANAGHFDCEVYKPDLEELTVSRKKLRRNIEGYIMADGRTICLLAEGRLVNLASGDGHPAEIMDMSFGIQALSAKFISENYKTLDNKVIDVPDEIDQKVAGIKLAALGIEIDSLTNYQMKYIKGWDF